MKLKRAKAYKKLLHQYELNFGFREPYQVLLDAEILQDAYRFKIDLIGRLEKLLQGTVKPMITTCSMRHLYTATPKNETLILQAKEYERRRCGHHELETPLGALECLSAVVDPKDSRTNKNRYIVASNEREVRAHMRRIAGVPLIYINKSVVLMEPMANATEEVREKEEKSKFKEGLKGARNPEGKRKREEGTEGGEQAAEGERAGKKKKRGPKAPNPLSVRKPKKEDAPAGAAKKAKATEAKEPRSTDAPAEAAGDGEDAAPRKRKRKHKPKGDGGGAADGGGVLINEGDAGSP